MNKRNLGVFRLSLVAVCIVLICGLWQSGSAQIPTSAPGERADIIRIDAMMLFGKLEKPPVEFLHDIHTRALALKKHDCTTCHLLDNDRLSPKFKRLKDTDKTTIMNLYHKACIACHGEMRIVGEKTGPIECDDCHSEKARFTSSRQPMGFDRSLHYRHELAQKKCEACHHEYDDKEKKLIYVKDKEGTCRYCHGDKTIQNRISMELASHEACIGCHLKKQAQKLPSGPVQCAGCHDVSARNKIEKITDIPRMERKQPDSVLIKNVMSGALPDIKDTNHMDWVPFDHKAHDSYNDTCRSCHHKSLKACTTCHTATGSKDGDMVRLETAMHQPDSKHSCRGCHLEQQKTRKCAGCHGFMDARLKNKSTSCSPCHMQRSAQMPELLNADEEKAFAAELLEASRGPSRKLGAGTYKVEDVPLTVVIGALSKKYAAVEFPHRRIIKALADEISKSKLAAYFHIDPGTLCQGCHHRSPASQKPPGCRDCHYQQQFSGEDISKPGIKGAYHIQCMGCHKQMGIEKPVGCTDCHKKL